MSKMLEEMTTYDELVDETTRHLFDGLLTGGAKELRSRVWAIMHPVWREKQRQEEDSKGKNGGSQNKRKK